MKDKVINSKGCDIFACDAQCLSGHDGKSRIGLVELHDVLANGVYEEEIVAILYQKWSVGSSGGKVGQVGPRHGDEVERLHGRGGG